MFYVEILIAALAAFALGALWYTVLFGKYWQKQTGITDEQASKGVLLTHGLSFVAMLAYGYLIQDRWGAHYADDPTFTHGMAHAAMTGLMFVIPLFAINYLYQKRSIGLFLVDMGYYVSVLIIVSGLISMINIYEPGPSSYSAEELKESIEWAEGYLKGKKEALDALQGGGN